MYTFSQNTFDIEDFAHELSHTHAARLVLFGAAGYGEALYRELLRREITLPMVFTDNDWTKQEMQLAGRPIVPPDALDPLLDLVAITSISAGESISYQLESMGFVRNRTYFEVMRQHSSGLAFSEIQFFQKYIDTFDNLSVLHVGPGGYLGAELLLCGLGARTVVSVEYHSFRLKYPDLTSVWPFYRQFAAEAEDRLGIDLFRKGLLIERGERGWIQTSKIALCHPCSVTALPFTSGVFDLVLHHAVFEHVCDPGNGYREIYRVLKSGGRTAGLVDPQDHRTFSSLGAYHPLKFLEHERSEWENISEKINFHNQVTTPEHRQMIRDCGFVIDAWEPLMEMEIPPDMRRGFHPYFQQFEPSELGVLRFGFAATKP